MFMTMVQVVIPTGKVAWYLLHALFGEENWQMGFVFEGAYLFLVGYSFHSHRESISHLNNDKKEESTFFSDLGIIIKNPVFLMGIVVRAVLYGVNTALHFWISDYMRTALNINDSFQILISYSIIAVTGPLGGVLASSFSLSSSLLS